MDLHDMVYILDLKAFQADHDVVALSHIRMAWFRFTGRSDGIFARSKQAGWFDFILTLLILYVYRPRSHSISAPVTSSELDTINGSQSIILILGEGSAASAAPNSDKLI